MGTNRSPRQITRAQAPLVAFDFDGTLTSRDSFVAFIRWRTALPRLGLGIIRLLPAACLWLVDHDRGRLKSAAIRIFLGGLDLQEARREAEAFAGETARALLRPDALARWEDWREEGARLVVVTASPEFLVAPFAARLG
jgi:phosphatidylglycerophosphatase C